MEILNKKKVIFLSVRDVVTIPSQNVFPKDCTDFQLKYELVEALRACGDIVRVNILADEKDVTCLTDSKLMLKVICYSLSALIPYIAFAPYWSYGKLIKTFEMSADFTRQIDFFKEDDFWLILGNEKLAEVKNIDYMSMEDFINGIDSTVEGNEEGEEAASD